MVGSNEQRSGRWSLRTETRGHFLEGRALVMGATGADLVVAAEATDAFSSSHSVSVNGKGRGISGVASRKSEGSSWSLV